MIVSGLNFERAVFSAAILGPTRGGGLLRGGLHSASSPIPNWEPTIEAPTSRFKIADMVVNIYMFSLLVYHAAHLLHQHKETMVETTTAKMLTSEAFERLRSDSVQVMGEDGWTQLYTQLKATT